MAASLSSSLFLAKPFLSSNPTTKFPFKRTLVSVPPLFSASPFRSGTPPETDCPVPFEQQPVNEYQSLLSSFSFAWAAAELNLYVSRLVTIGASFAFFLGLPVVAKGDPRADAAHVLLGAASAGIVAVTVAVIRIYLGWAYVGNRLLSATVEYEETGWYDGQTWVKTPEVLARDRLLGSFTVKPILDRVKFTLVGLAISLVLCIVLYINTEKTKDLTENFNRDAGERVVVGKYSDESARSFEPDAFCGEPDSS